MSPAAASYYVAPGEDTHKAFKRDVLRIEDRKIAEITTFDASLFAAFGLPETLEWGAVGLPPRPTASPTNPSQRPSVAAVASVRRRWR